jgi:hypothetical protein
MVCSIGLHSACLECKCIHNWKTASALRKLHKDCIVYFVDIVLDGRIHFRIPNCIRAGRGAVFLAEELV